MASDAIRLARPQHQLRLIAFRRSYNIRRDEDGAVGTKNGWDGALMELRSMRRGAEPWAGFVALWVLLTTIWLALTSSFDIQSITAGATISAVLAYVFAGRLPIWRTIHAGPSRFYHFLLYTYAFFRELVRANLAVMRYVYAPRIRIQPGVVRAKTRLKSPVGRLALANSVTLTPGSLVLDVDGDDLVVHCLDLTAADPEQVAEDAVRPVEKHLEKVFG